MIAARDLTQLFRPRRVAVVGASDNPARVGGRVLRNLVVHGYKGGIIPVNAASSMVQGISALQSVDELDAPVDLAVLAVNASQTVEVMKRLLDGGTLNFISFAAGGAAEQLSVLISGYDGAALVGPNSNGIWNVQNRLIASFGGEADRAQIADGPVAIVAHSGSLGGAVARRLQDERVGTRYLVSAGNEVDLSLADYIEFFLTDAEVSVIGAYIEGVRDGERLKDALYRAAAAGIQVVVQLGGLSRKSREATASHTGKALSSPALYKAVLQDCGALVVESTAALVQACRVATGGFFAQIPAVGAIGISGGMLAIIADSCETAGLEFAALSSDTEAALASELPTFSAAANPVDVTGAVLDRAELLPFCARTVAEDPTVDALVVGLDNKGYSRICSGEWIAPLAHDVRKPIALVLWDRPPERHIELESELIKAGVAVVTDPSETGATLRWMCRASHVGASSGLSRVSLKQDACFTQEQLATEAGQLELAAYLGLCNVPTVSLHEVDERSIEDLIPPLVVKPLPNRVQHKTDRGLVQVGLLTHAAARLAIRDVLSQIEAGVPVLVQEQARGVEVLLSTSLDVDWGPVITVGIGGKLVELIADLVTVPLPCDIDQVGRALRRARLWPLLEGYRGDPPADVAALLFAAQRLQEVFLASDLSEIELNPIMVAPAGEGAFMIDLLTSQERVGAT